MGELVLMKQEIQQLCKFTSTADTFSDSDMFDCFSLFPRSGTKSSGWGEHMRCQGMICTWEKLSEASGLRLLLGELQGSLQQTPWHRDAGGVLKPPFSPTIRSKLCWQCNTLGSGKSLPLPEIWLSNTSGNCHLASLCLELIFMGFSDHKGMS